MRRLSDLCEVDRAGIRPAAGGTALAVFCFWSRHSARAAFKMRARACRRGFAMRSVANALFVVALVAATSAFAGEQPPARVGRVAFVSGELGFHGKGETTWSKAS